MRPLEQPTLHIHAITSTTRNIAFKVDSSSITAYKSGGVLFQGKGIEDFSKNHTSNNQSTQLQRKLSKTLLFQKVCDLGVIGSDEVGNGAYFGPLTVAAAYVSEENIATLKKAMSVRDQRYDGRPNQGTRFPKIKEVVPYKLLTLGLKNKQELTSQKSKRDEGSAS